MTSSRNRQTHPTPRRRAKHRHSPPRPPCASLARVRWWPFFFGCERFFLETERTRCTALLRNGCPSGVLETGRCFSYLWSSPRIIPKKHEGTMNEQIPNQCKHKSNQSTKDPEKIPMTKKTWSHGVQKRITRTKQKNKRNMLVDKYPKSVFFY